MIKHVIYCLVAMAATTLGAMTGMGGGVIIKPTLDVLGDFDAATINILSSVTVFTMAIVSMSKYASLGFKLSKDRTICLAIGSLLGGLIGQNLFMITLGSLRNGTILILQNTMLASSIVAVFFYMRKGASRPVLRLNEPTAALLSGILMGMISSFLGIGGGPINVALLLFVCAFDMKAATIYSIISILCAQTAKLALLVYSGGLASHDLSLLPCMLFGAAFGGVVGPKINKKLPEKNVEKAFVGVQGLVFLICIVNIFRCLI